VTRWRLIREEGTGVLATLIRVTGQVDLAQDAAQDAMVRALETWPRAPRRGPAPHPVAGDPPRGAE
jgi:predicted RNA polymerase sigma factor